MTTAQAISAILGVVRFRTSAKRTPRVVSLLSAVQSSLIPSPSPRPAASPSHVLEAHARYPRQPCVLHFQVPRPASFVHVNTVP